MIVRKQKLKLRVLPRFLAAIFNGTGTTVRKDGLATYVDLDVSRFNQASSYDPTNDLVMIWNKVTGIYQLISPTVPVVGSYQSVGGASAVVGNATSLISVVRAAPTATALTLPAVASQFGISLTITDWSTSVTEHTITLTPNGSETIMRQSSFLMVSNAVQLTSITLKPSTDLNGWVVA